MRLSVISIDPLFTDLEFHSFNDKLDKAFFFFSSRCHFDKRPRPRVCLPKMVLMLTNGAAAVGF